MAKFKVGDRVKRFKGNNRGSEIGHVATIKDIEDISSFDSSGPWLKFTDGTEGYATSFVLAPKFAVGDRVRVVNYPSEYWDGRGVVDEIYNEIAIVKYDDGRRGGFEFQYIEPVAAAQQPQLTITSGRYYRTRDGRKVGPMERFNVEYFHTPTGNCTCVLWNKDGTAPWHGDPDLIAEWVDEPVTAAEDKPRFKVGDRVRGTSYSVPYKDKVVEGTITDVDESSKPYLIDMDNGHSAWLYREGVSLATPKKPAIVALIENGQPRPSANPFVHADREAATKEAKRLAGKHKGQEFGVYELVDTAKEAKVYEHEWQRLAAGGRKIDAIKRVRDATGFTLKGAKDAVEHWLELNAA